ncbi:hypothetical protein Pla52o_45070 [Novipirellula galeiformis]|uniref:Uncharacterized protein n=1 Tax=Novipirellula galeiformis TaxID=2528004 RepID=A0A5C6CCR1_9BACT|nr:hypothetical protein Pla52o_45070 [Novipirellula galeiformis]
MLKHPNLKSKCSEARCVKRTTDQMDRGIKQRKRSRTLPFRNGGEISTVQKRVIFFTCNAAENVILRGSVSNTPIPMTPGNRALAPTIGHSSPLPH